MKKLQEIGRLEAPANGNLRAMKNTKNKTTRQEKAKLINSFEKSEYHGALLRFREPHLHRTLMLALHPYDGLLRAQSCAPAMPVKVAHAV